MQSVIGSVTNGKGGRYEVTWPGVTHLNKNRIEFEGKEYHLLDDDSFPGLAKLIDEQCTLPSGEVLVLTAEGPGVSVYEVYGASTQFTTTDEKTGKTKMNREYLYGFRNALHFVREALEDLEVSSSEPVADFVGGNFGN